MQVSLKIIACISILLISSLTSVSAQGEEQSRRTVTAPMDVDCAALSVDMLQKAIHKGLCVAQGTGQYTNATVASRGNCGTATLIAKNDYGFGWAKFKLRLYSNLGPFASGGYSISWARYIPSLDFGMVGGGIESGSSNFDSGYIREHTGEGRVFATAFGNTFLAGGWHCVFVVGGAVEEIT